MRLLKPGKLYRYYGKTERRVYVQPNAYIGNGNMRRGGVAPKSDITWRFEAVRVTEVLKEGMVFMPLESTLCDQSRWTKMFVGESMGWVLLNYTDCVGVTFKELRNNQDDLG